MRWLYDAVLVVVLVVLAAVVAFKPMHRVGVIDLGRVADGLGMAQKINDDARAQREEALAQVKRMEDAYKYRHGELEKKLKAATGAEKDKVQADMKTAEQAFQQSVEGIRQQIQRHDLMVLRAFREKLQPSVDEVAQGKGLDVILDRQAPLVYVHKAVDVTEAVTKLAKKTFPVNAPLLPFTNIGPVAVPSGLAAPLPPAARATAPVAPAKKR